MKVSKEELKELIKLYSGMDKLSRAIWLGSGSLLLGKEMTEKEQMMVKPPEDGVGGEGCRRQLKYQ